MEGTSSLGASSSALPPLGQSPVGFGGLGVLPPAVLPGFGGEAVLPNPPAPGFGGQWQLEQFLHQISPELHKTAAAQTERLRLEAEAAQRAAEALQVAGQEDVSTAQACAEALTARRARAKANP